MSKFRILGTALFALLALGSISAASAFAAHEWLTLAGAKLTEAKDVLSDGTWFLHANVPNIVGGGAYTIECSGQLHGTVGPGSVDLISDILGSKGELEASRTHEGLSCKVVASTDSLCPKETKIFLLAENLPWSTELTLEGTATYDALKADGEGEPGYGFTCGFNLECHVALDRAKWLGNDSDGALFAFEKELTWNCTLGITVVMLGEYLVLSFNVS